MRRSLLDAGKLLSATAVSQGVAFLVAPALSRLYSPPEFGLIGVFLSLAAALAVTVTLRLELAVVVPRDDEDAKEVMVSTVLMVAVATAAIAVLVTFLAGPLARLLGSPDLAPLLAWLPLYVGSVGVFQVFNYWSTRIGRFGRLASAQVVRASISAAAQVGLGVVGLGAVGMLGGHVGGQLVGNLTLLGRSALGSGRVLTQEVRLATARRVLRKYREFALFGAPQALVNSLGQGIPAIFIAAVFGTEEAGQYLLASRVIAVPGNLLGQSFRQVLYPRLSRRLDDPSVLPLVSRLTFWLAVVATGPVALIALFGPPVFTWLFGVEWSQGGEFARVLGLLIAVALMNIPAVSLVPLLRMQRWHAGYEVVYLVARIVALGVGAGMGEAFGAVVGLVVVGLVFNAVLILSVLNRLRSHLRSIGKEP